MSGAWDFERYVLLVYVEMLYMNYPRCRNCAFSAGFVRECTDVSLSDVAGEGVELTVRIKGECCCRGNKGSGTEISWCAFIYGSN